MLRPNAAHAAIALTFAAIVAAPPARVAAAAAPAVLSPSATGPRPPGSRARDLGIPFDGTSGPNDAITDVAGVLVGHTTLISGSGKLKVGEGPVRTGVTAALPRGLDPLRLSR